MPTSYLSLFYFTIKIGHFAFFLSTLLGFILIFLTVFGVKNITGTYKYLMIIFTSLGIFLATTEMVIHPNLHFYNSGFVFFTLSTPFGLDKEVIKMLLVCYSGVYATTISLIAVEFIYRYWTLFSIEHLEYFRGPKSLIWLAYCLSFGTGWAFSAYKMLKIDKTSENYFNNELLIRYNIIVRDEPILAFLAYEPNTGWLRWRNVSFTVVVTFVMGFQYSVMLYCGWNMYWKMEEKIKFFSVDLKFHHKQLFKTLVLQITAPTVLLFSPLIVLMYVPYFQIELSLPAGATACAFNLYPAMDSIIVLLVVTEYRVAALRMWNSLLKKTNRIANTTLGSSQLPTSTLRRTI